MGGRLARPVDGGWRRGAVSRRILVRAVGSCPGGGAAVRDRRLRDCGGRHRDPRSQTRGLLAPRCAAAYRSRRRRRKCCRKHARRHAGQCRRPDSHGALARPSGAPCPQTSGGPPRAALATRGRARHLGAAGRPRSARRRCGHLRWRRPVGPPSLGLRLERRQRGGRGRTRRRLDRSAALYRKAACRTRQWARRAGASPDRRADRFDDRRAQRGRRFGGSSRRGRDSRNRGQGRPNPTGRACKPLRDQGRRPPEARRRDFRDCGDPRPAAARRAARAAPRQPARLARRFLPDRRRIRRLGAGGSHIRSRNPGPRGARKTAGRPTATSARAAARRKRYRRRSIDARFFGKPLGRRARLVPAGRSRRGRQ